MDFEDPLDLLKEPIRKFMWRFDGEVSVLSDKVSQECFSVKLTLLLQVPFSKIINKSHEVNEAMAW